MNENNNPESPYLRPDPQRPNGPQRQKMHPVAQVVIGGALTYVFFGCLGLVGVALSPTVLSGAPENKPFIYAFWSLFVLFPLAAMIYAIYRKHPWYALGIVLAFALPFLAYAACYVALAR